MKVLTVAFIIAVSVIASIYSQNYEFNDDYIPKDESDCACPRHFDPVCASNAKTYSNDSLFECARKYWKSKNVDLQMIKRGACKPARSSA